MGSDMRTALGAGNISLVAGRLAALDPVEGSGARPYHARAPGNALSGGCVRRAGGCMSDRSEELRAAIEAVRAASRVCRAVQEQMAGAALEKRDKSPVTVADFASQAIVCRGLAGALPGDPIVAEEASDALREAGNAKLLAAVVDHVSAEIGGSARTEEVLGWIDRGGHDGGARRFWALDPIDGTKGFLRGEQYAVALGLIEDGQVVLGVLGCPNLPTGKGGRGALFAATAGAPARVLPLSDGPSGAGEAIAVDHVRKAADARFCESVESGHSDQEESARIASLLGIAGEPYRIDSQCKYAAVARGDASIYLRLPTRVDYREKIWDHAAGKVIVEAAGGRVTDVEGLPLDFGRGETLAANNGIVATSGAIHDEVIDAIRRVREAS
jgi:3'(2'), 5'-bisphosphate nucleotidase